MRVEIKLVHGTYWLVISTDVQVLLTIPHDKLIEAYETACSLKLHVDNSMEFEVRQYRTVS